MKGDFSRWSFDKTTNAHGVLHQQGRVLLDADWNAQTRLVTRWQDEAGQAAFGHGVAAVPAEWRDSFEISQAELLPGGIVRLTLAPGQLWADGLLLHLVGDQPSPDATVLRPAEHLEPPLQTLPTDIGSAGTRDAVVLEVHREALNGFQVPAELIEAALGGPDTTERMQAAFRFRLLRLAEGETCASIHDRIADDFSTRGRLTVSLQDTVITPGDCPVVEGGGYTGFEHNLYRIEIAELGGAAAPMFKWSQFNGGLVGRGSFNAANRRLSITANRQPILRSGLQSFYLEAFEPDPDRPPPPASVDPELTAAGAEHWRLVYGARVTLANDDEIDLPTPGSPDELFGSIPGPADRRLFFRLWNDIREIADFPAGSGNELRDGIEFDFDAATGDNYLPYDYWTFDLRAGGIENDDVLIDNQPPEGVRHLRVPLAILNWTGGADPIAAPEEIDDCRRIFQPLTRLSTCCTLRVGDGVHSHGDYTTISEALLHLPTAGGRICVLPGIYRENVLIENREAVSIIGCGDRSRVISAAPTGDDDVGLMADPVFHVLDSQKIRIESLAVEAHPSGIGVLVEESDPTLRDPDDFNPHLPVRQIRLALLRVEAAGRSGIEVLGGAFMEIVDNRVLMADVQSQWPAVAIEADDVLFKHNLLRVLPARDQGTTTMAAAPPQGVQVGVGGLWLRGGCERIRVIDNWIVGGIGHGITLGHIELVADGRTLTRPVGVISWIAVPEDDPCFPCGPGGGSIPPGSGTPDDPTPVAGPPLREILIERNRIEAMGVNGISVIGFFANDKQGVISVEDLTIIGNLIRRCLRRPLEDILDQMVERMGFGGIVLADVELLAIRDNRIAANGRNHLEPICGVYLLHGEGVDLSRNTIIGNGAKTDQKAASAKQGARGGIVIQSAVAPIFEIDREQRFFPNVRGIPAVKVHDNVVSTPLGQSLLINALGPVSIVANQLSSHGVYRGSQVAATVQILDLGVALEFLGAAAIGFAGLAKGMTAMAAPADAGSPDAPPPEEVVLGTTTNRAPTAASALSRVVFNGNVMFHDNQCLLELLDRGGELALSSVSIMSLDDVSVQDNQSDCELIDDFVLINAFIIGITTRILGNRLKEGLFNTLFSAMSWGFLNMTAHNEATHCLITMAAPNGDVIRNPNLVMIETAAFGPLVPDVFHCARWRKIFERDG